MLLEHLFYKMIKEFGFSQNMDEPCVYKKISRTLVMFIVLYIDYILLIGNDIEAILSMKNMVGELFLNKRPRGSILHSWDQIVYRPRKETFGTVTG